MPVLQFNWFIVYFKFWYNIFFLLQNINMLLLAVFTCNFQLSQDTLNKFNDRWSDTGHSANKIASSA